jgi:hypothetical protein
VSDHAAQVDELEKTLQDQRVSTKLAWNWVNTLRTAAQMDAKALADAELLAKTRLQECVATQKLLADAKQKLDAAVKDMNAVQGSLQSMLPFCSSMQDSFAVTLQLPCCGATMSMSAYTEALLKNENLYIGYPNGATSLTSLFGASSILHTMVYVEKDRLILPCPFSCSASKTELYVARSSAQLFATLSSVAPLLPPSLEEKDPYLRYRKLSDHPLQEPHDVQTRCAHCRMDVHPSRLPMHMTKCTEFRLPCYAIATIYGADHRRCVTRCSAELVINLSDGSHPNRMHSSLRSIWEHVFTNCTCVLLRGADSEGRGGVRMRMEDVILDDLLQNMPSGCRFCTRFPAANTIREWFLLAGLEVDMELMPRSTGMRILATEVYPRLQPMIGEVKKVYYEEDLVLTQLQGMLDGIADYKALMQELHRFPGADVALTVPVPPAGVAAPAPAGVAALAAPVPMLFGVEEDEKDNAPAPPSPPVAAPAPAAAAAGAALAPASPVERQGRPPLQNAPARPRRIGIHVRQQEDVALELVVNLFDEGEEEAAPAALAPEAPPRN